jgi:hypothetical protein
MARHIGYRARMVTLLALSGIAAAAFGQKGAPPPPTTGTGTTTTGTTPGIPNRTTTTQPGNTQQQQPYDLGQRPVFLSGKVTLDDGTPPPEPVVIERVCGSGNGRPEAYTDSKGRFSFQVGQNSAIMADASVSSMGGTGFPNYGGGGQQSGMGRTSSGASGSGSAMSRDMMNCELRASLPGYRSDVVNLAGHRMFDNPEVGTIVLHRLGNVEGTTISAISLQAPKDAKKAYDKGKDALKKKKTAEAEKEFQRAVEIYPKFATAWFELGHVQQQQNQVAEARKSYQTAVEADPKYVNPYLQLSLLAAKESNWQDLADTTARVLKLDPVDYPHAYFLNSVANYNLKNYAAAEKSVVEAQKLDTHHLNPKIEQVFALILMEKRDYPAAAEHLRSYLQFAPSAQDAAQVRNQLAELDKVTGGSANRAEPPK